MGDSKQYALELMASKDSKYKSVVNWFKPYEAVDSLLGSSWLLKVLNRSETQTC